ncbi:hypothetical protein JXB01_03310, partial [Candidatus Micrarchaeota archaeon]|nr:hypothetical protein [Candidatus Micrarchaeota archaeon]
NKNKNSVELELTGADEGVGEILSYRINEEPGIKFAAYRKPHPFSKSLELKVETKDKDAMAVVKKTAEKIGKEAEEIRTALKK